MENMIHVGGKIEKDTAENIANFVEKVFKAGKENGMDQSTVVHALSLIGKAANPENVTITNSHFQNRED